MKSREIYAKWLEYSKSSGIKTPTSQGRDPEDTDLIDFISGLGLPKNITDDVFSNFSFGDDTQRKKERIKKKTKANDDSSGKDKDKDQSGEIFSPRDIEYIDKVKKLVDGFNKKTKKKMLRFLTNGR